MPNARQNLWKRCANCGRITPALRVVRTYPKLTEDSLDRAMRGDGNQLEFVRSGPILVKVCEEHAGCVPAKNPAQWFVRVFMGI